MTDRIPLVLGPGLLNTPRLWRHQVEHLSDIADIGIVDTTKDDSLIDMAKRMLDDAPPAFAYAGLSMGGYMAFEMMRLAPERVQRLALLDTSARGDIPARTANRKEFIALAENGDFDTVKQRSLPILLHPDKLDDADLVATTLGMADEIGPQVFIRQMTAIMNRRDNVDSLGAIKAPTMVICGREDQGTPLEVSEEIAAGIPGARLCVVENCGHLSTLEQPEAVTALLRDWLTYD